MEALYSPALTNCLEAGQVEKIMDQAVQVLQEIGIACGHAPTIDLLVQKYTGTDHRDGRIHFNRYAVEEFIRARRKPGDTADPEPPFTLGKCWMCLNYCDPVTHQIRPATAEEAALMARFWDARGIDWCIPVNPGDVPPALITLAGERIALKNSRYLGGFLSVMDPEEIRYLIDMFKAAGRTYRLDEQVGLSPLRFNDHGLESARRFMGSPDIQVILSGSIPMAGATCALDPFTAAVQSTAESVAADLLCAAYEVPGGGLMRIESFDFRHSGIVWGSPEWCLYHSLIRQVAEYYTGRRGRYGSFRSTAKQPDAQAQTERTASVLWQALNGARNFNGVGQICIDEVFSPQQVIFDQEILGYAERICRGMELEREGTDALTLIREGMAGGTFMATGDTVEHFRDFFWEPDMYAHTNLGRWQSEGARTVLAEAWEKARAIIAASDFHLADEEEREVDAVYEKACRYVKEREV